MTIEQLKSLIKDGKFHHATYRTDFARGLHIYGKQENGFNGSEYDKLACDVAYSLVRRSGVYEGSYK